MRQRLTQRETERGPGGRAEPGKLLCEVGPDRRRIGLEMLIRLAASVFAVALSAVRGAEPRVLAATAAVLAVVVLWPMRHWRDGMELHSGGVVCRGAFYPMPPNCRVTWVGTRLGFLPSTLLQISGSGRRIDVSFMKDAEKLFARAYNNVI